MVVLLVLVIAVLALIFLRQYLTQRENPRPADEPFEGNVYRIGDAYVAERPGSERPPATVVFMHGYLADLRYAAELYTDPEVQLLALNSGGYHLPIQAPRPRTPDWAETPVGALGAVGYDAQVLIQALRHLPRSERIRVHGHSRGGAVVLEAARRAPELFERVEVVLEAPVLPGAKTKVPVFGFGLWLMPLTLPLWQRRPISPRNTKMWGRLDNPRKRELICALPFNPRTAAIMVVNLKTLVRWMNEHDESLYRNVPGAIVLVPDDDQVLDAGTMRASAERGGERVTVVAVTDSSHFVALDRPRAVPPLTA